MGKTKIEYRCKRCGREIEFGDNDVMLYDGNIYCCDDCAIEAAGIVSHDWDDYYEYDYTEDESNGYGIRLQTDEWYGNGAYIIWDKCPFSFDDDYKDYFGFNCRINSIKEYTEDLYKMFDEQSEHFKTIKNPFYCPTGTFEMPIWIERRDNPDGQKMYYRINDCFFDKRIVDFIIKMLNNGDNKPEQIKVIIDMSQNTYILFIVCNNKRAAIAESSIDEEDYYNLDEA